MSNKDNDKTLVVSAEVIEEESSISPQSLRAINALRNAKIPKEHIKKHPGKGNKIFSYVPHTIATDTMNDAFRQMWDWEILSWQLLPDNSAIAQGKLSVHWYDRLGREHVRVVTELGGNEPKGDKNFVLANIVVGAASRTLLRCMLRMFGYGREFYPDEDTDITFEQAWKMLEDYAKKRNVDIQKLGEAIKSLGITRETLVDRFEDAYKLVEKLCNEKEVHSTI